MERNYVTVTLCITSDYLFSGDCRCDRRHRDDDNDDDNDVSAADCRPRSVSVSRPGPAGLQFTVIDQLRRHRPRTTGNRLACASLTIAKLHLHYSLMISTRSYYYAN